MTTINAIDERLDRRRLACLSGFILICGLTWLMFGAYYSYREFPWFTVICIAEAVLSALIIPFAQGSLAQRRIIVHGYLVFGFAGIMACSVISGQAVSYSQVFLCCTGLIAAHLVGLRAAFVWTIISVIGLVALHWGWFGPFPMIHQQTIFDKVVHCFGLTLVIFLFSCQAQLFFNEQTEDLIDVTGALRERTNMLSLAEEVAEVGHWRWDMQTNQIRFSRKLCSIYEINPDLGLDFDIETLLGRFSGAPQLRLMQALYDARSAGRAFSIELSFESSTGRRFSICRGFPEFDADGNIKGIFGIMKDDTEIYMASLELEAKAAELRQLATFDPLTELCNRRYFLEQAEITRDQCLERGTTMGLVLLDMDSFKQINDTQGHPIGDEVLKEVGRRLAQAAQPNDIVARLGGDEFVMLCTHVDASDLSSRVNTFISLLDAPIETSAKRMNLTASIGAAICPEHATSLDDLMSFADTAMYAAKSESQPYRLYHPEMTSKLLRRHRLEERLTNALQRDQFYLVYQPQVCMATGRILGFEALLRWDNGGIQVSPRDFMPVLETIPEIMDVGNWVLRQACQQVKNWSHQGFDVDISVNFSAVQFRNASILDQVTNALRDTQLDPNRLCIEITESILIEDVEITTQRLIGLKQLGVSISIDDFGTGYSSLAYLKNFPIDQLKIDRDFIKDFPDTDDGIIASSMVQLGQNLELDVVAEGIESQEQLKYLQQFGCHRYQGFYFSHPISPDDALKMLQDQTHCRQPSIAL